MRCRSTPLNASPTYHIKMVSFILFFPSSTLLLTSSCLCLTAENAKRFAHCSVLDGLVDVVKRHKDKPNVVFYAMKGLLFIREAAVDDSNGTVSSVENAVQSLGEDLTHVRDDIQKLHADLEDKKSSDQREDVQQKISSQMDILERISSLLGNQ